MHYRKGRSVDKDFHDFSREAGPWTRILPACGAPLKNNNRAKQVPKPSAETNDNSSSGDGNSSESDCSQSECQEKPVIALPEPTKRRNCTFPDDPYCMFEDQVKAAIPAEAAVLEQLGDRLGFGNHRLWSSFGFFLLLMLSLQPETIVPVAAQQRLAAIRETDAVSTELCRRAPFLGGQRFLDPALRRRPQYIAGLYDHLFSDEPITAATFSLWSYLDAAFRYTGTVTFLQETFVKDPLPLEFAAGLVGENALSWVQFAQSVVIGMAELRTTFTALFDGRDGRRLTYGKYDPSPPMRVPGNRLLDHMLAAFEFWPESAIRVGDAMTRLYAMVTAPEVADEALEAGLQALMLALLTYHLLGRHRLKTEVPFSKKVFSYGCKFLLQDHLHVLGALSCLQGRAVRCGCRSCRRLLFLRQVSGFLGPAPRSLYKRLVEGSSVGVIRWAKVLPTWVHMVRVINAEYDMSLDFYSYQALPCFFLCFVLLRRRFSQLSDIPLKFEGKSRAFAERAFRQETVRLRDIVNALRQRGLLCIWKTLDLGERQDLLDETLDDIVAFVRDRSATSAPSGEFSAGRLLLRQLTYCPDPSPKPTVMRSVEQQLFANADPIPEPIAMMMAEQQPLASESDVLVEASQGLPSTQLVKASVSREGCSTCGSRHGYNAPKCCFCLAHCKSKRCGVKSHRLLREKAREGEGE